MFKAKQYQALAGSPSLERENQKLYDQTELLYDYLTDSLRANAVLSARIDEQDEEIYSLRERLAESEARSDLLVKKAIDKVAEDAAKEDLARKSFKRGDEVRVYTGGIHHPGTGFVLHPAKQFFGNEYVYVVFDDGQRIMFHPNHLTVVPADVAS